MPSARLDSHRNSVQNGVVMSFPALTGTIFVNFLTFVIFRTIFRLGKSRMVPRCRPPHPPQSGEAPLNPFPTRLVGHPRELTKQNKTKQNAANLSVRRVTK